jgi:hypothetical protein
MPRSMLVTAQCDGAGCGVVQHASPGRMLPAGWRNTITGLVLCGRCSDRHMLDIAHRNGYPVPR